MLMNYDLRAGYCGGDGPPKPATVAEATAYLLDRGLRAQGIVSLDSICHLDAPSKPAVRRLIERRVRRKEMVPVPLESSPQPPPLAGPRNPEKKQKNRSGGAGPPPHPPPFRSAD